DSPPRATERPRRNPTPVWTVGREKEIARTVHFTHRGHPFTTPGRPSDVAAMRTVSIPKQKLFEWCTRVNQLRVSSSTELGRAKHIDVCGCTLVHCSDDRA